MVGADIPRFVVVGLSHRSAALPLDAATALGDLLGLPAGFPVAAAPTGRTIANQKGIS